MALKFVREHIESFGGDPDSVTLMGQSSGARSITLHMVSPMSKGLFHRAIAMSGSMTTPLFPKHGQMELAVKQAQLLNCPVDNLDELSACLMRKPADSFSSIPSFLVR